MPPPDIRPITEQFERSVRLGSERLACVDGPELVTYGELFAQANYISNALMQFGIGSGDRVAVVGTSSRDTFASLLGILRSGAAYVPIDPRYPLVIQQHMVDDAQVVLVVVTSNEDLELRPPSDVYMVTRGASSDCFVQLTPSADDLASIIYTSGSTGIPKGVMITHGGLANLAIQASKEFELTRDDRFLTLASPSFSASLEELFPPLSSGSCVVFPSGLRYPIQVVDLLNFIHDYHVTLTELQTSLWQRLVLETDVASLPPSLRLIVMGGEAHLPLVVSEWSRVSRIPLVHVYGPTEATATVTYYRLSPGESLGDRVIPIGRAIDGVVCLVLNEELNPVPDGKVGELFVGGIGLADGYFEMAEATESAFIESSKIDGRLYRTGDLVREVEDGVYEFVGRSHGPRGLLDVGTLENWLIVEPAIEEAIVVLQKDYWGDSELVAYVRGESDRIDTNDLQRRISARLSRHIKVNVVMVHSYPRQFSGKVDRRALAEMGTDSSDTALPVQDPTSM